MFSVLNLCVLHKPSRLWQILVITNKIVWSLKPSLTVFLRNALLFCCKHFSLFRDNERSFMRGSVIAYNTPIPTSPGIMHDLPAHTSTEKLSPWICNFVMCCLHLRGQTWVQWTWIFAIWNRIKVKRNKTKNYWWRNKL